MTIARTARPDTGHVFTRADGALSVNLSWDTSATVGLVSGETLKEVSERLGHSTITITNVPRPK